MSTASFLNFQALAAKLRGSELLKALNKPSKAGSNTSSVCASPALYNVNGGYAGLMNNGVCNTSTPHMSEILNKYIKNNWDLPENSGNSRSAAELTCTLILAMARHVPQAAASMKQGKWARKDFMGEEVYGKTLAIIGLGRIGQEVASRMQAFGMKTVGYDPLLSNEDAAKRQIKWLGGIINEKDLVDSLNANHIAGAAIDVFVEEPPTYRALVEHPKVVCTPHLGASTLEAQQRVAIEIAENIISLNNGTGIFGALNASALAAVLDETNLAPNTKNVVVKHPAGANGLQKALIAGTVVGLLQANGCAGLNLVNAEVNAIKEGIMVKTEQTSGNELTLSTNGNNGQVSVTGYASPAGTVISAINGAKVPVPVLAVGNLAISKQSGALDHKFGSKASVEYGLLGGGHLALFGDLNNEEIDELSKAYSIVQFGQ
uniref:D-isomer specific 2-hydroxyacid dehydrogenase NAD-binding domain-containing protein n=1 Tax=Ditylenchus dipsaci TaxID=166011 RepID=A0A915D8G5_9BILA